MRKLILGAILLIVVFSFADPLICRQEIEREYTQFSNNEMPVRNMEVVSAGSMEVPPEMQALLRLAAVYSERLRHAAFRFICQETVSEDLQGRAPGDRSSGRRRNTWLYEYQVVVRAGQVSENRVLLRKNKTKMHVENAVLETRFRSEYSAFLPATLFAAEMQPAFFYRLDKHEKMNGRKVARISVTPRPGFEGQGASTAWVDVETGAVLKVEISQGAITGIESAEERARQAGARLRVSDVHYYEVERDGIWLPSRTSISEHYVLNAVPVQEMDRRTWDLDSNFVSGSSGRRQPKPSRTWVKYSDFRFFVVEVKAKEVQ